MTLPEAILGVLVGLVSGVLSGLFGVGGGIVMTPGIQVVVGTEPIVALATPLPAILPTALTGALTYRQAGEIDLRAAGWIVGPGIVGAIFGAALTDVVDTHLLLVITAVLLAGQAVSILRGARQRAASTAGANGDVGRGTPSMFVGIGLLAGFVSGLLGIGGGLVIVPMLVNLVGMPLKRALGTSLLAIVVLVIPGTIVHAALGHIDWAVFLVVTLGAVPGARLGATLALGARERTLRLLVATFLLIVSLTYGVSEVVQLLGS
jgi:uncharacterized membrane protein YfcA